MDQITRETLRGVERGLIQAAACNLMESDDAFREAVLAVQRSLIEEWADSEDVDQDGRERTFLSLRLLNRVVSEINSYYEDYQVHAQGLSMPEE